MEIQVTGYERLPVSPKFNIEVTENTELASFVQARLKEALVRQGFDYGRSARLVMTITAEKIGTERSAVTSFDQPTADTSIEPAPATSFGQPYVQFHIGIDDGSSQPYAEAAHEFRISLDLYDRQTGRYLWRGQIADSKPDADPFAATKPMIEQLVKALASWAGPER